jgi:hypothetical protein
VQLVLNQPVAIGFLRSKSNCRKDVIRIEHRSVYFAERLAAAIAAIPGVEVSVTHAARRYWEVENRSDFGDV